MRFGFEEGAWLLSRELLEGGPSGAEVIQDPPRREECLVQSSQLGEAELEKCWQL